MKIARKDYMPLCAGIICSYIFIALFMVRPDLASSGWISCITGYLLALPGIFACQWLFAGSRDLKAEFESAVSRFVAHAWYLLMALLLLFELHTIVSVYTGTVLSYSSDIMHENSIKIIVALICGLVAQLGIMAVTSSARIVWRLSAVGVILIAAASLTEFNLHYLAPILGPGIQSILSSVFPISGIIMLPLVYLFTVNTQEAKMAHTLHISIALGVVGGMGVLLLYALLMPTLPGAPTSFNYRTNMLLNNGLTGAQTQLPILLIWNGCALMLISALMALSARLLGFAIPKLQGYCAIIVSILAAALVYASSYSESIVEMCNAVRWPLIAVPLIIAAVIAAIKRRIASANGGTAK